MVNDCPLIDCVGGIVRCYLQLHTDEPSWLQWIVPNPWSHRISLEGHKTKATNVGKGTCKEEEKLKRAVRRKERVGRRATRILYTRM